MWCLQPLARSLHLCPGWVWGHWLLPTMSPSVPAGNCVVLKPSELSKGTEKVLAEVLPQYLDQVRMAPLHEPPVSHTPAPVIWGRQLPPGPAVSLEPPAPPCRAALPWCWEGPRRPGSCWSTSSTTSSSRVSGLNQCPGGRGQGRLRRKEMVTSSGKHPRWQSALGP